MRNIVFYFIGSVLYLTAGYLALYLMGAPMDALRELVLTALAMLGLSVAFFLGFYLLVDRWVK